MDRSESWVKYWAVFDNASSTLSYFVSVSGQQIASIQMNTVVSFRTDTANSMLITTTESKIHLRANNSEEMKGWLFCFQKSVALVLSHLIESSSASSSAVPSSSSRLRTLHENNSTNSLYSSDGDDSNTLGKFSSSGEFFSAHDRPLDIHRQDTKSFYRSDPSRRRSSNDNPTARAFTDEDIQSILTSAPDDSEVRWERSRSTRDLSRLGPQGLDVAGSRTAIGLTLAPSRGGPNMGSSNLNSQSRVAHSSLTNSVAMSPAIPIFMGVHPRRPQEEVKLAGSYVESYTQQHLEDAIRVLDLHTRSASDAGSEFSQDDADGDDDGMLIFDLDDGQPSSTASTDVPTPASGRSKSRDSRSRENSTATPRFSPSFFQGLQSQVSWISGSCSRLGPRSSNEDRIVALPTFDTSASSTADACADTNKDIKQGYFAVYDGHCGSHASTHLQETLHARFAAHPAFPSDLQTAILETCIEIDREFLDQCREKKQYCGTTALGAWMRGSVLTVFNIGDCQAVLSSNGAATLMSIAHQPGRPDESERITKAGGWITEEKELYMGRLHRMDLTDPVVRDKAQQVNWVTINRVCGELAVSRSIGDPDYKGFIPGAKVDALFNWPDGHEQIFHADLVIPVPEFVTATISPSEEFLLLASDGLWDVVSCDEAVARTR